MAKGRPYGSLDKRTYLSGKELVDKLANKDGFITRDVGFELIMGYANVPWSVDTARYSSKHVDSVDFAIGRKGTKLSIK